MKNDCKFLMPTGVPKDSEARMTIFNLLVSRFNSKIPTDESITIKLFPLVSNAKPNGRPQCGKVSSISIGNNK